MDLILPEHAAHLRVKATTGAGNISLEVGDAITDTGEFRASVFFPYS